ncbi:tail assembly protein [Vibrio phage vB_VpaS_AL-2]|nr:tail assembly protein [Vibrio phage vB_VpaS_AL-2]
MSNPDTSYSAGQPVEMYMFEQGTSARYFTSHAKPVSRGNLIHVPKNIQRDDVEMSDDSFKGTLTLTLPRNDALAVELIGASLEIPMVVTLFRGHLSGSSATEVSVYWKGRVVTTKAQDNVVKVDCESVFTALKRAGLRARYEKTCRHEVFDGGCKLSEATYRKVATIGSIDVMDITLTGEAAAVGYYTAGMVIFPDGSTRLVTKHESAGKITISRPHPGAEAGQRVTLLPGCDHSQATCKTKFNNFINYGGWPYIPIKNPFGGSSFT